MDNKKILVTQSSMPLYEEYCKEISEIWNNKWLTNMGPIHNRFKDALINFTDAENVELFVNGHQALVNAWKSLGINGEVITTPFTFASTINAIVEAGLTPVFCDINEDDYTIDVNKIERLITDKTVAICGVHVYGAICDVEAIDIIAKKNNLIVLYDAAHAFGVKYKDKGIGSYGDISMFSFHATKVFNTIEGGALCYKNADLTNKIVANRNFGLVNGGIDVELCGSNAKMNEFQAAMGICNLRHLSQEIAKRKAVSDMYDSILSKVNGIKILKKQENVVRNYAYYPIVINKAEFGLNRDELCKVLNENNIFPRKYFYPSLNDTTAYKGKYRGETPIAREIASRVLCLPIYADLELESVERIAKIILNRGAI